MTILIQTPNEAKLNEWLVCEIQSISLSSVTNIGTLVVKGVVKSTNVTTAIIIRDVKALLDKQIIKSLNGYYKLQLINESDINILKQQFNEKT